MGGLFYLSGSHGVLWLLKFKFFQQTLAFRSGIFPGKISHVTTFFHVSLFVYTKCRSFSPQNWIGLSTTEIEWKLPQASLVDGNTAYKKHKFINKTLSTVLPKFHWISLGLPGLAWQLVGDWGHGWGSCWWQCDLTSGDSLEVISCFSRDCQKLYGKTLALLAILRVDWHNVLEKPRSDINPL